MDISPRSGAKRASEPVDDWLRTEGFFRKNAPHDATCLFRAVSEQVYLTQYYHLKVREQCVKFMRVNREIFEKDVKVSFDNYLDQLACVTEWGGEIEIRAMARLYKRDVVIFNASKLEHYMATDNGFKKSIYLCQLGPKIYESIFERETISNAGFCQSLIYRTLYKDVFHMSSIDEVVQKMLHERASSMRHDKFFLKSNLEQRDHLAAELLTKMDTEDRPESPQQGLGRIKMERAPFPYRVAKALDPTIYRNIDFDIWHELRKEVRCSGWTRWNNSELQIGAKCLVQLDESNTVNNSKTYFPDANGNHQIKNIRKVPALLIGHIQEMSKDEGPVVVFIEELGEKRTVPFVSLKPLLATRKPHLPLGVISPRRHISHEHSPKYRNKWTQFRKFKDTLDSINNNDQDHKPAKKNLNTQWEEHNTGNYGNPTQSPTVILKPFTSVDNYNSNTNNFVNNVEARPVSIILDNPPPLMSGSADLRIKKEESSKPALSPTNNNNNSMVNNNTLSQMDGYDKSQDHGQFHGQGQSQVQSQFQTPPPINEVSNPPPGLMPSSSIQEQTFYPQPIATMYTPNPGLVCLSEVPYPVQYYQPGDPGPPPPIPDRSFRAVNITPGLSNDVTGADLPYSDPITLRFFYNLGVEAFRCGHMWTPGALTPQSFVPATHPISMGPSMTPAVAVAPVEGHQRIPSPPRKDDEGPGRGVYHGKRRNDGNERNSGRNSGMSCDSRGSYRSNYPKKEGNFQGSGTNPNSMYEFKNKSYGEDKESRDIRDGRDQRKNGHQFRNNNNRKNDRSRNFERNNSFQDYQKGGQGQNSFRGDNNSFRRGQNDSTHPQNVQATGGTQQFQAGYQQPVYGEVYYTSDGQGFYPANANFFPAPFVGHPQEANEGAASSGTYVCTGVENFQPPMSPMYPQFVYPPPGMYSGANPGGQESWYPVGAPQPFVPFQVPVSQPPPNMPRPPTTS